MGVVSELFPETRFKWFTELHAQIKKLKKEKKIQYLNIKKTLITNIFLENKSYKLRKNVKITRATII